MIYWVKKVIDGRTSSMQRDWCGSSSEKLSITLKMHFSSQIGWKWWSGNDWYDTWMKWMEHRVYPVMWVVRPLSPALWVPPLVPLSLQEFPPRWFLLQSSVSFLHTPVLSAFGLTLWLNVWENIRTQAFFFWKKRITHLIKFVINN